MVALVGLPVSSGGAGAPQGDPQPPRAARRTGQLPQWPHAADATRPAPSSGSFRPVVRRSTASSRALGGTCPLDGLDQLRRELGTVARHPAEVAVLGRLVVV